MDKDINRLKVVLAEKKRTNLLGYTKSSFSQIVNGRVTLSDNFVKKLCGLDENINEVWKKAVREQCSRITRTV